MCLAKKKTSSESLKILQQLLLEKFIGNNLSITDIALKNWDLWTMGLAQGCYEVIDYRYRLGTERFIVAISGERH